jgi:hypothetical protein
VLVAPSIGYEHGMPFQIFYGIARKVIGYTPEDDVELMFADEIRQYLVEPGRII